MSAINIVIIKTGDSLPALVARRGDFEDWILAGLGKPHPDTCTVIPVHKGGTLPEFDGIGGIIVTGSHAMVTERADWSERTAAWLRDAVERQIAVLGICFGHQLLADALGGRVAYIPGGPEFGTVEAILTEKALTDPLFAGLPRTIAVQTSHYQAVTQLPPGATLLASSEKDPHSAFRCGARAWGVQFHPEYDAGIANAYVEEFNRDARKSGGKIAPLPLDCRDSAVGRALLERFAALVARGKGQDPV